MNDNYYSVLVCIRDGRKDVYINGIPVSERIGNVIHITTKRTDIDQVRNELREADCAISECRDAISMLLKAE